jgi:uncharacterized protein DUF6766
MRRFVRANGLSIAIFGLFAVFLVAQSITGWHAYESDLAEHGADTLSYAAYLTTGHFVEAVFENWESEFLQMASYIVLTVWLVQKGSPESKPLQEAVKGSEEPGVEVDPKRARGPVRRGGWFLRIYEHSLSLAFAVLFLMAIVLHAVGGAREFNSEQVLHGEPPITVAKFVTTSTFWFQSFQNWQSEFLAMGTLVVLSIFLRERGSPQSKPVEAPHDQTGT